MKQRLQSELDAREREKNLGLSREELQQRLQWSQANLAHTRALLSLYEHRVAGAMECVALYKAIADGLSDTDRQRDDNWQNQLQDTRLALYASEERSSALQEELHALQVRLRSL